MDFIRIAFVIFLLTSCIFILSSCYDKINETKETESITYELTAKRSSKNDMYSDSSDDINDNNTISDISTQDSCNTEKQSNDDSINNTVGSDTIDDSSKESLYEESKENNSKTQTIIPEISDQNAIELEEMDF